MVTTLYLIRHGATAGSHERRYKGSIDVPLSALGEDQARDTGRLLQKIILRTQEDGRERRGANPAVLFSSPQARALLTATLIGEFIAASPLVIPDLRERHFGQWEGLTFEEAHSRFPEDFSRWMANPLSFSPSGGESTLEVKKRGLKAIRAILAKNKGKKICVVAHGGVNRVLLCHFLGMPLKNLFRLEQDFAAVNIIDFHDELPVVRALNLTCREDIYG